MRISGAIKDSILKQIENSKAHTIFFISDFAHIACAETTRKILNYAIRMGLLERISHGVYVKPMVSRFGNVPPSLEDIARSLASRYKAEIIPTGSTAANLVGLSTQVPMNLSYITTGSTRTVRIGKRSIRFVHAAPRNFAAKGKIAPLLVQGMKEIGENNIGNAEKTAICNFISSHPDEHLTDDILLAPAWIQKILKPLISK
jgi:predicted transcriptional regulator of viral defense system